MLLKLLSFVFLIYRLEYYVHINLVLLIIA